MIVKFNTLYMNLGVFKSKLCRVQAYLVDKKNKNQFLTNRFVERDLSTSDILKKDYYISQSQWIYLTLWQEAYFDSEFKVQFDVNDDLKNL